MSKQLHDFVHVLRVILSVQVLKDVEGFLRIPKKRLKSRQVKIHNGPLADHIKNWDDVKKTLTGTPYEDFLHSNY